MPRAEAEEMLRETWLGGKRDPWSGCITDGISRLSNVTKLDAMLIITFATANLQIAPLIWETAAYRFEHESRRRMI
jgi:hypothetical protein